MDEHGSPAAYGSAWHEVYDHHPGHPSAAETDAAAGFLRGLGQDILELGVGTGRLAVPLADRGARVTGVDVSPEMLDRAREKSWGGEGSIELVQEDIRLLDLGRRYDVVCCVFNTLLMVGEEGDQLEAMRVAARHLRPGGHCVVQSFVPDVARLDNRPSLSVRAVEEDGVWLLSSSHDLAAQRIWHTSIWLTGGPVQTYESSIRFLWPSELRLLALACDLEVVGQYSDWDGTEYQANDPTCISVFRRGQQTSGGGAQPVDGRHAD